MPPSVASSSSSAIVTIQLGQCGNQVGAACFEGLAKQLFESNDPSYSPNDPPQSNASFAQRFFHTHGKAPSSTATAASTASSSSTPAARAVLIDMEPKVIQQSLLYASSSGHFHYNSSSSFYRQSGSGNNWSYGFSIHGPQCRESMLDKIRLEVESSDHFGGFMMYSSLAGGTGSGVGAYLTECLYDEYPREMILNSVVWPYKNGEVIVQNYNALLTLAHLNEFSSGLLLFSNDSLHSICSRRLGVRTPSFLQLNRIIAEGLTKVLLPSRITQAQPFYAGGEADHPSSSSSSSSSISSDSHSKHKKKKLIPPRDADLLDSCTPLDWFDTFEHLFAHPAYKLSTLRTIPQLNVESKSFQASTWAYLMKYLYQMQLLGSETEDALDFSVGTFSKQFTSLNITKRQWHRHHSATASATTLFEWRKTIEEEIHQQQYINSLQQQLPSTQTQHQSSASTSLRNPPPSLTPTSTVQYDPPLPPPVYSPAYLDGESYLETRMRLENDPSRPPSSTSLSSSPSCHTALASLLYLRGTAVCSADASSFLDPSLYASFAFNPIMVTRDEARLHGDDRTATLWTNSSEVVRPMEYMMEKVDGMIQANAYIHHYEKYGIDKDWFNRQRASIKQIQADYQALQYQQHSLEDDDDDDE